MPLGTLLQKSRAGGEAGSARPELLGGLRLWPWLWSGLSYTQLRRILASPRKGCGSAPDRAGIWGFLLLALLPKEEELMSQRGSGTGDGPPLWPSSTAVSCSSEPYREARTFRVPGPWAGVYAVQTYEGDVPSYGGPHPFRDRGRRVPLSFVKAIQVVKTAGDKVRKSGRDHQSRGSQSGWKCRHV